MQQMYTCPNCKAQVVYGQAYCANCKQVFYWQAEPSQDQYQSQYSGHQQQWGDTASDYQSGNAEYEGQGDLQENREESGFRQAIINNRALIAKIAITVVIVAGIVCAGLALQGVIAKLVATPVIVSFSASSPTVVAGKEATLQWNVTGASTVTITPDVGAVSPVGKRAVAPGATTAYTLLANNMFGYERKTVTITVTGVPPAINSFSVSPDNILSNQTAALSWNVANATSVSIDPGIGVVPASGTRNVSPGSTTRYVLTASNTTGNATASATLNITVSNKPIITTFSISPDSINSGEDATITWEVIGAKSINISGGVGGVASRGSALISPAETTTYTLMASNEYSAVSESATITVDTSNVTGKKGGAVTSDPPVVEVFTVTPDSITLADNVTLNWTVKGARTVSISPGIGAVPSKGWMLVVPTADTTYMLTAVNTFGEVTAEAMVNVETSSEGDRPVIRSFTATPPSINLGGTSSLTWNILGATVITIDQGIGRLATKYSQIVSPEQTTTYTLTAINSTGTDSAAVTVTVIR